MSERLKIELAKRLPHLTDSDRKAINAFAENYGAKVTVNSFNGENVVFKDLSNRSVVVTNARKHGSLLYVSCRYPVDVFVFTLGNDRDIIGWCQCDKMIDAGSELVVDVGSIYPMPDDFNFGQPCAHGARHGMWMDESSDKWVCFGCGLKIVSTI